MKNAFAGYYRPTDVEFQQLWQECDFVLDANVLLNLYRYSPNTTNGLLDILESLADRLWVSHQAAKEYHANRLGVIHEQAQTYDTVIKAVKEAQETVRQSLEGTRGHPFAAPDVQSRLMEEFTQIVALLDNCKSEHPDLLEEDRVLGRLTVLLEGKVGAPPHEQLERRVQEEGPGRYSRKTPPGYEDSAKRDSDPYGDLLIWLQIIEHASATGRPVVLITDDTKEDWWWKKAGRTVGPRPELVEEFIRCAGRRFYMYTTLRFLMMAPKYLKINKNQGAIDEVREYQEQVSHTERRADGEEDRQLNALLFLRAQQGELFGRLSVVRARLREAEEEQLGLQSELQEAEETWGEVSEPELRERFAADIRRLRVELAEARRLTAHLHHSEMVIGDDLATVSERIQEVQASALREGRLRADNGLSRPDADAPKGGRRPGPVRPGAGFRVRSNHLPDGHPGMMPPPPGGDVLPGST